MRAWIGALLVVLLTVGACSSSQPSSSADKAAKEPGWNVREIYPTRPGGMEWYSSWDDSRGDPWVETVQTNGHFVVHPDDGVMSLSGETLRMYVRSPHQVRQWTGAVEVTIYAMRVPGQTEHAPPYSGIVSDVRTNHGTVGNIHVDPCDSRGLFARLRFDGYADFGKEVRHPRTVPRHERRIFRGEMPSGEWIGYKHVVYDTEDGLGTVQELWMDDADFGQSWELVNRIVDRGRTWGRGEEPCAPGIDPALPLLGGTTRAGSESGRPNISVMFRADSLGPQGGLEYRWASIREVEVQQCIGEQRLGVLAGPGGCSADFHSGNDLRDLEGQ
jgi:hypothetical protein